MTDGVLDVCIVEALSKGAFLRAFPKVFTGRHTTHPKVRMMRATNVTVEANRGVQVYADGERVGPLPASFDVMPGRACRRGRPRREGDRDERVADGVLLVHAFPLDARMWHDQAEWLRGLGWHVAAPSLPGFGGTPGAGEVMSMGAAADRCLQVARRGGHRARRRVRSVDGRLRGVRAVAHGAAAASPASCSPTRRSGADAEQAADGSPRPGGALAIGGQRLPRGRSAAAAGRCRRRGPSWARFVRELIADQPAAAIAAAAEGMARASGFHPRSRLDRRAALVLTSSGDTLIPPEVSLEHGGAPSARRTVTIAGAGHLSNLEAPQAFRRRWTPSWAVSGASEPSCRGARQPPVDWTP